MPLKFRCPHCRRVLIAEDDVVGQRKLCPSCNRAFDVPLHLPSAPAAQVTTRKCPHCAAEIGLTVEFCYRCHRDLASGRKLPWKSRVRLLTWRFWLIVFSGSVAIFCVAVGVRVYLIRARVAPATSARAASAESFDPALAARLLDANSVAERAAALQALRGYEARAVPAVVEALRASLGQPATPQRQRNRLAAIDLVARQGESQQAAATPWIELLERCTAEPDLRIAAVRARAVLGDARVTAELSALWLDDIRRLLLLTALDRLAPERESGLNAILQQTRDAVGRAEAGLRRLARDDSNPVFEHLVDAYWQSWSWLGQERGSGFAEAFFDLVRTEESTLEFAPTDVRGPRDILRRIAERGRPGARAAAGLILRERAPQYRTLSERIGVSLGGLLHDANPVDQQRLTFAIGLLRHKLFGAAPRQDPYAVTPLEIAAAQQWVRPAAPVKLADSYPSAPTLVYRATTGERLLERDLLTQLEAGWGPARIALGRWLSTDLGLTPRLAVYLHPGSRQPNYAALAAALVVVADRNEQALRPQLELWRDAADQPTWLRALAYTVLGSFDARNGLTTSGWPAGLNLGDIRALDAGTPGWDHLAYVLVAGGPAMQRRLTEFQPPPLSPEVQRRLLEATRRLSERHSPE